MTTLADLKDDDRRQAFIDSVADAQDDASQARQTGHLGGNKGFEVSSDGLDEWISGALEFDEEGRKERMRILMDAD